MGLYPIIKRPTPIFTILENRPTIILRQPLAKMLDCPDDLSGQYHYVNTVLTPRTY